MIKRVYLVYFLVCLFALAIVAQTFYIQVVDGEKYRGMAQALNYDYHDIEAVRGNIYAEDGSLLATSVPKYDVHFDPNADAVTEDFFEDNLDSLAICLAAEFTNRTVNQWRNDLRAAREKGSRYHRIASNVDYVKLQKMREFPLFRRGRFKGGFIVTQRNTRSRPFDPLASRTIGYQRQDSTRVGLELAYNEDLAGVNGKRLMQRISGGDWKPISDENEIEPENGCDLITTIDLNIQDVAENALLNQLKAQKAKYGCVVLMEVQTGHIKAIANLTQTSDSTYFESYNYAVGEGTEPGSTFKLASYMALLEDRLISLDDSIDTGDGRFEFYDTPMLDSKPGGYGKITFKKAFAVSSNIAISKAVVENYGKGPQSFIDRLYSFGIHQPNGVEIPGEGKPYVKSVSDSTWSGISMPWMSIGYELKMTPLQVLTLYNAVANYGTMVKPQFVKEIQRDGEVVRSIDTEVLNAKICSMETIKQLQSAMEAAVEEGTATNLRNADYKIAGKTGTAQIYNRDYGYYQNEGLKHSYQASFAGYFPADNPKYSCIVVVNAPSQGVYYGNQVAGPIFKEIADKVYSTSIDIHPELAQSESITASTPLPVSKNGYRYDLEQIFEVLGIVVENQSQGEPWVATLTGVEHVEMVERRIAEDKVPDVVGMDAMDAVYLLENQGLKVRLKGRGMIKKQSITAGSPVTDGATIELELS